MAADKKPIWYSRVFWGVAILILNRYVDIPEDVQQDIPLIAPDAITAIVDGVGALLTLWGRAQAKKETYILPWRK